AGLFLFIGRERFLQPDAVAHFLGEVLPVGASAGRKIGAAGDRLRVGDEFLPRGRIARAVSEDAQVICGALWAAQKLREAILLPILERFFRMPGELLERQVGEQRSRAVVILHALYDEALKAAGSHAVA